MDNAGLYLYYIKRIIQNRKKHSPITLTSL